MAGLYFHIPFCRRACNYCDFHFSTRLAEKGRLVASMCRELELRQHYLKKKKLNSLYFGGGTPSLLEEIELKKLLLEAGRFFEWSDKAEITLEVNPDDVNESSLMAWKASGINRLSIGLQSFNEKELQWMHRLHSPEQSVKSVQMAQQAGFDNISIDLIYGSKWQDLDSWKKTLETALSLGVRHISAYNLTIESGTELGLKHKRKQEPAVDGQLSAAQFRLLREMLQNAGFRHYEISNFGKPGFEAVHNSSYWSGEVYLGIGPSAHSFDSESRQWNISNNPLYCKAIEEGSGYFEREELSRRDKYNEYVMTGLRTLTGCDLNFIERQFGKEVAVYFSEKALSKKQWIKEEAGKYSLKEEGLLLADALAAELFLPL